MKIAPAVRTALQAIEDRGQATIYELLASDPGGRTKQSWYTSIWHAKEKGLVSSVLADHVATYSVTEAGREVLDGRCVHTGAPPVSMVAHAIRHQPTSVWALGARM